MKNEKDCICSAIKPLRVRVQQYITVSNIQYSRVTKHKTGYFPFILVKLSIRSCASYCTSN